RITEDVAYSWFRSSSGLHPSRGETQPDPHKPNAYSWVKAPRYNGEPMEVGSLARLLIAQAQNHEPATSALNSFLQKTGHTLQEMVSVMGRHAARAIESLLLVDALERWINNLVPDEPPCVEFTIPDRCEGMGLTEAARGALGHWIVVEDRKIARYQCVVPTTWNCSPKDDRGKRGPVEEALIGTPVANEASPIEAVRVVRSFDPCLACAVH
ncbi:MAG: nickel-dependent hydrogenase large subunit, partial [Chthoniobacterales bacterium]|nr:nickel-dependent hydrogenase large subunit [Chthoniobacterales bacterium]